LPTVGVNFFIICVQKRGEVGIRLEEELRVQNPKYAPKIIKKVQTIELCTKNQQKRCKPLNYAPKTNKKSANH
jgi:hypothetical protein